MLELATQLDDINDCHDGDMSAYGDVVDEVGQGQQALSFGNYDFPNSIAANLDLCGDFPTRSTNGGDDIDRIFMVEAWTSS